MKPTLARLNPFIAPMIRRISQADGVTVEELQPEETEVLPPAAILPGQIDRVTSTDGLSPLEYHLQSLTATTFRHAPVLRKMAKNAIVAFDGFATARHSRRYSSALFAQVLGQSLASVNRLRYCHEALASRHFGHWLTDAMLESLIDGPELGDLWMPAPRKWHHAAHYQQILDLPSVDADLVFARELIFYQDFGQGSHKRARYAKIRRALHARHGAATGAECVFISRGNTGAARLIRDQARLVDELVRHNWTIVEVSTASVDQLQTALCSARIVVSIDGSHLTHAQLSLTPGSVLIVLVPHDRFTTVHLDYANANRISAGFVVLEGSAGEGYVLNWDEVMRTIDLSTARAGLLPSAE